MNNNNVLRNIVLILLVLVLGVFLFGAGFFLGRFTSTQAAFFPAGMMGYGQNTQAQQPYGMMGEYYSGGRATNPPDSGYYGPGMMGGGMMGGFTNSGLVPDEPLSIEQSEAAVQAYLDQLGDDNLGIKEVMIFDNQAYAEITEKDTGIGAMEVLVDPVSQAVYPEPGPNMMWNLKYGMMSGYGGTGMMGGMMGFSGPSGSVTPRDVSADMPLSPDEAIQTAQQYLNQNLSGTQAGDEADRFYGYYTIHIERDGSVIGMLSVNGYNGQVFPHTWHGQFLEMSEEAH